MVFTIFGHTKEKRKEIVTIMEKERKTDIDLGLDMNAGIKNDVTSKFTEEEREIAKSQGRNPEKKEESDATAIGIANFRVLSNGH